MKKMWAWVALALALALFGAWLFRYVFTDRDSQLSQPTRPAAHQTITLQWLDDCEYAQAEIDEALAQFGRENGVKVQAEHVSGNYDVLLKTRLNAGEIPDVWMNRAGDENGMFAQYAYDWAGDAALAQFDAADIAPCREGDAVVGLPGAREIYGLIYNKRLFAQAGIGQAPQTLTELKAACAALKAAGILPFCNAYKEARVLTNIAAQFHAPQQTLPGGSGLDTDALLAYLDLTLANGQPNPLETDWRAAAQAIAKGEAAMSYLGNWCETTIKRMDPYVNIGLEPLPVSESAQDARLRATPPAVWKLNASGEHLAQARALLLFFLTSEQGQALNQRIYGAPPADGAWQLGASGWPSAFGATCPEILQSYLDGSLSAQETAAALSASWADFAGDTIGR